jgi:hypothetical protein
VAVGRRRWCVKPYQEDGCGAVWTVAAAPARVDHEPWPDVAAPPSSGWQVDAEGTVHVHDAGDGGALDFPIVPGGRVVITFDPATQAALDALFNRKPERS